MNRPPVEAKKRGPAFDALQVRSIFVSRGTTFNAWAIRKGFSGKYAHLVLHGKRTGGEKTLLIVDALKKELGL